MMEPRRRLARAGPSGPTAAAAGPSLPGFRQRAPRRRPPCLTLVAAEPGAGYGQAVARAWTIGPHGGESAR